MGWGDELIASGQARALHQRTGKKVLIVGVDGKPRWSELWTGLPYILPKAKHMAFVRLINGPNARPYIASKSAVQWRWKPFKPTPAEIKFTDEELAFAEPLRGYTLIEPTIKAIGHDNKAWLPHRWFELADRLTKERRVMQCMQATHQTLHPGVRRVVSPTFRHAAAVLSVARAFVGTEGGMMHAAAAVGTPSVILWSEFISPEITGYDLPTIRNIRHAGVPCGNRVGCLRCRTSMESITVDEVLANLQEISQ